MGGFSSFNLLFWVLFFYFLILIVQISTACVVHERIALLQIKDHLNSVSQSDGDSILSSWEEHSDCCKWEHVECDDSTGQITNLYLGSTVLAQDPWTLNLTYFQPIKQLQSLHLDGNNIQSLARSQVVGPSLEKLQVIDLRGNNLQDDGIIPLDSLISLHELHLSDNNLNGASLSKVLSKLKNLKWLNAENNQLRGTIANLGICQTTRLQNLFLGNNDLEGDLPNCIGKFSFLQTLGLSYNKLFGDAASIIPIPISLELFDIEGNKFEGKFPIKTLFNHSKLQYLSLSSNLLEIIFEDQQKQPMFQLKFLNLSGCHINWQLKGFQNFLSSQYNLDLLNLGSNNLSGSIPAWIWQNKSNLQQISLYNNSITGDFSFHNQTMLSLKVVILSNNKLSGPLPHNIGSAMPNLINLDMSKNSIKGLIPESIGEMLKLNMLDLSHNNLSGDIPRELFTNCISLEVLVLSYNHLHGNLFPKYANFPQLRWLELQNNNFSGALQDTLLKSSHFLSFMDISHNEITGRIPTWISGLQELVVLSLAHNQLRGTIPREVCKLEYLEYIDFSKNKLTGGIPACCSPSLKFLHLHNNNLGGAIANTLSNCSKLITLDLSHNQLSKEIPTSIDQLLNLKVLLLGHNKLQGQLPIQLCKLGDINIMDLSNNDISDAMLSCFANLSFGTIRLEDFDFNGGMLKGKWFSKENIISIKVAAITVHIYIAMNL